MKDLKQLIHELINDRPEQANVTVHEYLLGKVREIMEIADPNFEAAASELVRGDDQEPLTNSQVIELAVKHGLNAAQTAKLKAMSRDAVGSPTVPAPAQAAVALVAPSAPTASMATEAAGVKLRMVDDVPHSSERVQAMRLLTKLKRDVGSSTILVYRNDKGTFVEDQNDYYKVSPKDATDKDIVAAYCDMCRKLSEDTLNEFASSGDPREPMFKVSVEVDSPGASFESKGVFGLDHFNDDDYMQDIQYDLKDMEVGDSIGFDHGPADGVTITRVI